MTLTGTAATGAALVGGALRVIDRTGASRTLAAPIGSDGRYSIDVTGLSAPLLVLAEGRVGESTGVLAALAPTAPTNGSINVNVTPLTTAVAALVAPSGNVANLNQAATLAAVTEAQVNQAVSGLSTALAPLYAAAGITGGGSFNPMTTPFSVGQAGQDRLLDMVEVDIGTQGVILTNATAPTVSGQPQAGTVITLNSGNLANPPVMAVGTGAIAVDFLAELQQRFNTCFAVPAASRATSASCTSIFNSSYLMHGYTAAQRWLGNDPAMNNAQFVIPELIYSVTDGSDGSTLPVLRISWVRSDGEFGTLVDVAKNYGTTTAADWKLRGNLRDIEIHILPRFARLIELSPTLGASRYELGLRATVNIAGPRGNEIAAARVRGPGLPGSGLVLVRGTTCGTDNALQIGNEAGAFQVWTTNASLNYRIAFASMDPARPHVWPGAGNINHRNAPMTSAELAAIRPGAGYQWEVWFRDPVSKVINMTPVNYGSTLSSTLPDPLSGPSMVWNTVDTATLDSILGAASPATNSATINYTRAAGAEPIRSLYVFGSEADPQFNPPVFTDTTSPLFGAFRNMQAISPDLAPTATSVSVSVANEGRGVDFTIPNVTLPSCSTVDFPALTRSAVSREIGLNSIMASGVQKRSTYIHRK